MEYGEEVVVEGESDEEDYNSEEKDDESAGLPITHKPALYYLPAILCKAKQGQLVLGSLTPHVGDPACSQPVLPKCIK